MTPRTSWRLRTSTLRGLLLTPEVCDFADDQHWSEWRVDGDWLCHTRVSLDDPTPTPTVLATLRNLIAFAELIASKANDDSPAAAGGTAATGASRLEPAVRPEPAVTGPARTPVHTPGPSAMFRGNAAHNANFRELRTASGFQPWKARVRGRLACEPVVCAGAVYVGTIEGDYYALDALTGAARWHVTAADGIHYVPAVTGDTVVFPGKDGVLRAFGTADGAERWERRTGTSSDLAIRRRAALHRADRGRRDPGSEPSARTRRGHGGTPLGGRIVRRRGGRSGGRQRPGARR